MGHGDNYNKLFASTHEVEDPLGILLIMIICVNYFDDILSCNKRKESSKLFVNSETVNTSFLRS